MVKVIRLLIPDSMDRENIVTALAFSSYKVWVQKEGQNYFVYFEVPETKDV